MVKPTLTQIIETNEKEFREMLSELDDPILKNRLMTMYQAHTGQIAEIAQEALEKAKEAQEVTNFIIENVSHEFKTPLTTIKGFLHHFERGIGKLESLEKKIEEKAQDVQEQLRGELETTNRAVRIIRQQLGKQKGNLYAVFKESERLCFTVSDLLDYAELHKGQAQVRIRELYGDDIIKQVIDNYRGTIYHERIKVINNINGYKISIDAPKAGRAINRIVDNAIKFSEDKVTVEYSLRQEGQNQYFDVKVSDRGEGIDPDKIDIIYDALRRGEEKLHVYKGLGLGMSIAKKTVDLLDGEINVDSEPFEGTTITLSFKCKYIKDKG